MNLKERFKEFCELPEQVQDEQTLYELDKLLKERQKNEQGIPKRIY